MQFRKSLQNFYVNIYKNFPYSFRLLQNQSEKDLKLIFSVDFDVEYFLKILEALELLIKEDFSPNQKINELLFFAHFLKSINSKKINLIIFSFNWSQGF